MRTRRSLAVAIVVAGLLVTGLPVLPAGADTGQTAARPAATAAPPAPAAGVVVRRDERGRAHYLAPRTHRASTRRAATPPVTAARRQLGRYGSVFGVSNRTLRGAGVTALAHGRAAVRFQQTAGGLRVLGGQLATLLDRSGGLVAITGETSPRVVSSRYAVAGGAARAAAVRVTAREQHLAPGALRAGAASRWLYDASLFDDAAAPGARASWVVTVTAPGRLDVRELVVVDGVTGAVRLHVNQVERMDRVVCDNANRRLDDYVCKRGRYARVETPTPSAVSDVNQAFDNAGATAAFFQNNLGVDLTALIGSNLGDGKKIRSTVRVCPAAGPCPYPNAFWDGRQMVYGAGFAVADDVVAHELAHAVTQHTSGLVYWYQSGAINESMSDVFGELVDQSDGIGNDDPSVRWVLGEDLPASIGPARNMANPALFQQPDQVGVGAFWRTDADDNGEVHINSGPGNKAAYLITDGTAAEPGGAFGGFAFPGFGVPFTTAIYWTAQNLLTPGADYADLAGALLASCLAIGPPRGVTPEACNATVGGATAATLMARPDFVAPTAPQGLVINGGDGAIRVRWSPPASLGTADPSTLSYVLVVTPDVGGENFVALDATPRDQVISGLPPAKPFTFGLMAVTPHGNGPITQVQLRGTRLTLKAHRAVRRGQVLRLHGRLTLVGGTGMAHRPVVLRQRLAGHRRFTVADRSRTRAGGFFRFRLRPQQRATYVVTFGSGTRTELGTHSLPRTVRLRGR